MEEPPTAAAGRPVPVPGLGPGPRPRPVPIVTRRRPNASASASASAPGSAAPSSYAARLKWLKKCVNVKHKYAKPGDQAAFKSALERRRAIQSLKAKGRGENGVARPPRPVPVPVPVPLPVTVPVPVPVPVPAAAAKQQGVTFKCRKCSATTFASLDALKRHQLACSATKPAQPSPRRQVVVCSACGTYLESWKLYLHMREVHDRHICLFCLGLFSQAEKLASHLAAKHEVRERRLDVDELPDEFYLACCECELVFSEREDYSSHECTRRVKYCSMCNSKGAHTADCPKSAKRKPLKPEDERLNGGDVPPTYQDGELAFPLPYEHGSLYGGDERLGYPEEALAYANGPAVYPEAKPDKISASTLAQLIEEVKNCVSVTQQESQQNGPEEPKPKPSSEKESSDYSSASEDSNKLTVDLGPSNDSTYFDEPPKKEEPPPHEEPPSSPGDDVPIIELTLDRPLDRYPLNELLKVLLNASVYSCIYCNHARKIAVDGKQLGLHFVSQHKFTATVNSITAEELLPETIVAKIKSCIDDVQNEYINLIGCYDKPSVYDNTYECFQCYYVTRAHKDLYFHNRKMHQKTILLCIMCKTNFYTYSELICHLCPGTYIDTVEVNFKCCLCADSVDRLPSAFRLMVHLRKRHMACDVCLDTCGDQSKLSTHVWKHKLHHLCYRCGIAYRNKPDITKHLFWKHGTESVLCKKCLQKKWPHMYHFCIPPASFACDECGLNFSKAVYLKVHKRSHAGELPHECKEEGCTEKFISKNLLEKHVKKHSEVSIEQKTTDSNDKVIVIDVDNPEKSTSDKPAAASTTKSKKSKKSKSSKENKDNLLMNIDFPELNLSESGSSDDSEPEVQTEKPPEPTIAIVAEEPKPEPPVVGIWDNFKLYQESLEKQKPHVPKHVCDSDHDYCVIPADNTPDVEIIGETKPPKPFTSPKKKKFSKKKKNNTATTVSSSSDSSSDSDTSCSGGSNCSCCSSSGSSSSSSSSTSSTPRKNNVRKDSDASVVDIMATEEPPKSTEFAIAEVDLDTDESATDEEFYDEHPERIASKLLAEKRNQLVQLASSSSPVNNGTLHVESEPPPVHDPADISITKKKVKIKKKKREKKEESSIIEANEIINIPHSDKQSKLTINLQQKVENQAVELLMKAANMSDDSKRASKRRRVPNKFYGYSSDEEYQLLKPHLPPKLEWRKEDLPSPASVQPPMPEPVPRVPEIPCSIEPVLPPKPVVKESSSEDSDSSKEGALQIRDPFLPIPCDGINKLVEAASLSANNFGFPRPAGAREAREGESVYCYCRCPYDEVSEMIACDAEGCAIEWFHFECVGIMVPPKGKWFCPDCREKPDNK